MSVGNGDYTIDNHGTLYVVGLLNDGVKAWVGKNVEIGDHQQLGAGAFAVEHRYIGGIVERQR